MLALSDQRNARHHFALYLVAGVISVLLSAWINMRELVINPDAICYLLSAQAITEQGFNAGMHLCPQAIWPFYSLLLSTVVKLTHVSYQSAAYAVDGLFTLMTVTTFIAIIDTLGASKRIWWLAAAVILLSHEFNYVRQYIVRDHGFWAFYLLSLFFMLRFVLSRASGVSGWLYALAWSISLGVATLFRIEGAIFMLALPFAVFFMTQQTWRERGKAFLMLNLLTIITGAAIIVWVMTNPSAVMEKLGRLPEVMTQLQSGVHIMLDRYQAMRTAMIEHVLTLEAARDASLVLTLTLLFWYALNVIGNLSWIYSALVIYAWVSRAAKFASPALIVLLAYVLVNLAITLGFFAEHLFLAKRYLIAFTLSLMIWVPYALDHLIGKSTQVRYRTALYTVSLLVLVSAVGGMFDFGHSKLYIRQAGNWLAVNVPSNAKLYVNDPQLMYYSEHNRDVFFKVIKNPLGEWQQYDYIALRLRQGEKQTLPLSSVAEFANKRGDNVVIYKIK
jgi:hypothetical protein